MALQTMISWLLVHALFAGGSEANSSRENLRIKSTEPLWVVNLEQHGFAADERTWAHTPPERMIAFSNNEEVVVLTQTFEEPYQSTVRAFVLDAKSGSLRKRSEWTRKMSSGVFPVRAGGYAVLQEHGTSLYGPGFEKTSVTTSHDVEMVSPNGGRLAARTRKTGREVWITLDPETLAETGEIPGAYQPSISENAVAYHQVWSTGDPTMEIIGGEAPIRRQINPGAEPPRFVSEHSLALVTGEDFEVVDVTGARLFTGRLKYDWHQFAGCRDGSRMAVVEQRWSELRGIVSKELVRVFDLKEKTLIWSMKNRPLDSADSRARSGVALAPDCSLVAIRSAGLVRVFRLPVAEDGSSAAPD